MPQRNWDQLLTLAPVRAYHGRMVRCIPQLSFAEGNPPRYLFVSGGVNRCNPKGTPCIYMAEDQATAQCEYLSYYSDPEPQLTYFADFQGASILDLGDEATRKHFQLSR